MQVTYIHSGAAFNHLDLIILLSCFPQSYVFQGKTDVSSWFS